MAIRLLRAIFAPANLLRTPDTKSTTHRKRSRLQLLLAAGCLGFVVTSSTGCSILNGACRAINKSECIDDFMIGYRNKALAAKAWHRDKDCFNHCGSLKDFQAGYIAGYLNVAEGGNGCVPAIAPAAYWGWRYQSAGGQKGVNAWFAGYPMGAKAAEQEGVGGWNHVRPLGIEKSMAMSNAYAPQPVTEGATNPFYEEVQRYPEEPVIQGEPFLGSASDHQVFEDIAQPVLPEMLSPEVATPIQEPIQNALEAPAAPVEAPAAPELPLDTPATAPAAPIDDSASFGEYPLNTDAISEELIPRHEFVKSDDLVPRGSISDLPDVPEQISDSAVEKLFGESPVSSPETTDTNEDLPFKFE